MSVQLSIRERVVRELEDLSEARLQQVADFAAFLKAQERKRAWPEFDESQLAELYAEAAAEDRELAEAGMADYAVGLELEDRALAEAAGNPRRAKVSLEELLAGVTDENLHGEIDFGPPVGKEVW